MNYLIDGYNLFFKLQEEILPLQEKREEFTLLLNEIIGSLQLQVLVIFDSHYQNSEDFASKKILPHLEISFSPKNLSADQYILELLAWNATNTILVTSDRELSKKGTLLGAKTLSIEKFVRFIQKKKKKKESREKPLTRESKVHFERLYKAFTEKLNKSNDDE